MKGEEESGRKGKKTFDFERFQPTFVIYPMVIDGEVKYVEIKLATQQNFSQDVNHPPNI